MTEILTLRDALQAQKQIFEEGIRVGHSLPTYRQMALQYQIEISKLAQMTESMWSGRVGPDVVDVIDFQNVQHQAARALAALLALHITRLAEPVFVPIVAGDYGGSIDAPIRDMQGPPATTVQVGLYELHKMGVNVRLDAGLWCMSRVLIHFNIRIDTLIATYEYYASRQIALYKQHAPRAPRGG